jgi:hypothetical protein
VADVQEVKAAVRQRNASPGGAHVRDGLRQFGFRQNFFW